MIKINVLMLALLSHDRYSSEHLSLPYLLYLRFCLNFWFQKLHSFAFSTDQRLHKALHHKTNSLKIINQDFE